MWGSVKLGEVCTFQNGRAFKKSEWSETGLPIIRIQNLKKVETEHNFFDGEYDERIFVRNGDLLLSWSGTIKPFIWCHDDALLNQHVFKVSVSKSLDQAYAYYLLNNILDEISKHKVGLGLQHITKKTFDNFEIILPPLTEQVRIVAKLDATFAEIDRGIEVVKNKITEISSLYENAVTAEFTSIENPLEKKLSDVCEKITDGTHQTPKYFDEGYIFLSSKNVTSRKIDWENVRYIDETQHIQMHKRIAPRIGDVLLAKNGTTGVAAIVDKDIVFDIYVSLAWLRSKGDVLPEYLLEFVNSKMAREQFTSRTKGIGVPNLHLQEIREVIIRFPQDKEKQKLLIKKLKNIDDTCNRCKQINKEKHQNLVSLKSAILAQELQPQQGEVA